MVNSKNESTKKLRIVKYIKIISYCTLPVDHLAVSPDTETDKLLKKKIYYFFTFFTTGYSFE